MGTPPPQPFSQRIGAITIPVQTAGMTAELRNALWNLIRGRIPDDDRNPQNSYSSVVAVCTKVLRWAVESVPTTYAKGWFFRDVYSKLHWAVVYDVLDHFAIRTASLDARRGQQFLEEANVILAAENSGFRFIGGELTRVMHPAEAANVEAALATAKASGLDGVHEHITQALVLFGKRPEPDYDNAAKEAMHAVEAATKLIEGVEKGALDNALDPLAKRLGMHSALKAAIGNLYGFASDGIGVRHANVKGATVGEEDARFMIVTCSAAVNWIIAKADKAGLLKK